LWERLKRARVVQTLAIYLPMGWVVIEILTAVTNNFGLPGYVPGLALVIFIAGLPIVTYLSWALQWTSEGIVVEKNGWRSGLAFAVVLGVVFAIASGMLLTLEQEYERAAPTPGLGGAATEPVASVAVLPIEGNEDLGTVFSGEIAERLAKHPDLYVVSPSAIAPHMASMVPMDFHERLQSDHVVRGNVSADEGGGGLLTLELVNDMGQVNWRDDFRFGEDLESQRGAQLRASQRIAEVLGTRCPVAEYCKPADSLEALESYHRATALLNQKGPENLADAERLLKRAIEIAPDYGQAYQSLAITYLLQRKPGNHRLAIDVSRQALDRCATLGAAYKIWVPSYKGIDNHWIDDELQWQDALAMEPNNLWMLDNYAVGLASLGRVDVARAVAERSFRNNPLEARSIVTYAWGLFDHGQPDRILELADRAEALGDKSCNVQMLRLRVGLTLKHDADLALHAYDELPERCRSMVPRGKAGLKKRVEAYSDPQVRREVLDLLRADIEEEPNQAMVNGIELSDIDLAFDAIDTAFKTQRNIHWPSMWAQTPEAKAFRSDPRFAELVEREGLVEYWREVGWPAGMCSPLGESFVCDG
jgi:tetratricopeptide (TPR) repeat protein